MLLLAQISNGHGNMDELVTVASTENSRHFCVLRCVLSSIHLAPDGHDMEVAYIIAECFLNSIGDPATVDNNRNFLIT